jgi:isochorismate synthase
MTAEPPFVLCGPAGVLIADGTQACFDNVADAQSALRSGSASARWLLPLTAPPR